MANGVTDESEVKSEPNVVPLCDVLLVILIIFMIATPAIKKGVDVRLPTVLNSIDMPETTQLMLSIKKDGTIYVNEDKATMETLPTMLDDVLMSISDNKLYLKADQDLEYGVIVDVIQIIKDAGIEIVGIIAEKKTETIE
ncbi:MAG: biopolymer transporter ExbD [Acidobacteriota bacterium]|nr:biopolymer transporter ExbD [Acidobacteriota bacterium]